MDELGKNRELLVAFAVLGVLLVGLQYLKSQRVSSPVQTRASEPKPCAESKYNPCMDNLNV